MSKWKPRPWYSRIPKRKIVQLFLEGKSMFELSLIFFPDTSISRVEQERKIEEIIREAAIRSKRNE
jgi:hypothetical protein